MPEQCSYNGNTPQGVTKSQLTVFPSTANRMLFSRDGIPNPFHKTVQQVDEMVNPQGKDVILDRGAVKHTLEGAGILDLSVTSENFGGLDDRGAEFNFLSLHINNVTTMLVIGLWQSS